MNLSNENIIHFEKNGIQYIQFRKLLEYSDVINHAYGTGIKNNFRTSRADGKPKISEEEYKNAENAFKRLCEEIGTDYINIVKPKQAHTKNIVEVEGKINIDKPDFDEDKYFETDGLVTNKKGIILSTSNADCIILLFFDPVKKVISNVHSGWKGTLQRISVEAVNKMQKEYNCNPKDIICCICPSIRKCHFEVEKDVKEQFYNEFKDLSEIDEIIEQKSEGKWNIDTVMINKIILQKAGLEKENIIDSKICSVCNSDIIHSYRVEKEGYGLNNALIELV